VAIYSHQPQFWATLVWQSKNVSYTNYYSNATSTDYSTTNTDGYDSWNSDNLHIENATITTGDDCVAAKGNTTNLFVKNVTCNGGAGMTIGSVGQYADMPDYVLNVTFEDVKCLHSGDCAYVKTWQGDILNETSNGDAGGGGSGLVKNITFRNFELQNVSLPIQISQCIYAESSGHGCNTSKMAIEDVSWINFNGTSRYNIAASLYCSDIHPCPGITFQNVNLDSINSTLGLPLWNTTLQDEVYQCTNIIKQNTSGIPCNHDAPDFFSQSITKNVQ
jgi:galacturan 1,4-alpha-galacturonidase